MLNPLHRLMDAAKRLMGNNSVSSERYWLSRYAKGGNSGPGSYSHLAQFKAETVNRLVAEHEVRTVVEFGCGDGNQLTLATYPAYTGYDISPKAVEACRNLHQGDPGKEFRVLADYDGRQADLALSLDVVFHLLEDAVFDDYMRRLFATATRYVVIYSSDTDEQLPPRSAHVRHRQFTRWVVEHVSKDWRLIERIPNRYPYDGDYTNTSFCDFFVFGRCS